MVRRMPENPAELARLAIDRLARHEKHCGELQISNAAERKAMHEENRQNFEKINTMVFRLVLGVSGFTIITLIGWVAFLLWYVIMGKNGALP